MAIYFFHGQSGIIKIGRSREPLERKKTVQREQKEAMLLIGVIHAPNFLEKELHARFKHLSRGREFFAPAEDLYKYILEHAVKGLETAEQRRAITRHISDCLFDLESPQRDLIRIINEMRNELEQERIKRRDAEQKYERLKKANPKKLTQLNELRDLKVAIGGLKRESVRLNKANAFLIQRNMSLAARNNQLREQLQFLVQPGTTIPADSDQLAFTANTPPAVSSDERIA